MLCFTVVATLTVLAFCRPISLSHLRRSVVVLVLVRLVLLVVLAVSLLFTTLQRSCFYIHIHMLVFRRFLLTNGPITCYTIAIDPDY